MIDEGALRTAKSQATRVARNHRGLIPVDELVSECHLWLVKHKHKVEQWNEEGKRGQAKLRTALFRAAQDYAVRERTRITRTQRGDHYYYTPAVVAEILPDIWEYEDWSYGTPSSGQEVRGKSQPSEGFNRQASIVDVKWAVAGLPAEEQVILRNRYEGGGMEVSDLAYLHGVTEDAMRKRLNRIELKLCDRLGGTPPWWEPGRRARSNASAQAETRSRE